MSESKLTKEFYIEVTRLKLLNNKDAPVRFTLEKSPFTGVEDDDELATDTRKEFTIVGLIYPNSDVFNQSAFRIEIKLKSTYPFEAPEIRFLTPIYHPNVDTRGEMKEMNTHWQWSIFSGEFCNELLKKTAKYNSKTTLTEVIKVVVNHIDHPDIDYSLSMSKSLL